MSNNKFDFYRYKATGEVLPALKHPRGYEDNHPQDFEGCDGPAREADAAEATGRPLETPLPPVSAGVSPLYHSGGGTDSLGHPAAIDLSRAPVAALDAAGLPAVDPYTKPQGVGPVTTVEGLAALAGKAPATELELQEARDQNAAAPSAPAPTKAGGYDGDVDALTVAELKAELDSRGIEYASTDLKADLAGKLSKA
jgi:hypothetical protein